MQENFEFIANFLQIKYEFDKKSPECALFEEQNSFYHKKNLRICRRCWRTEVLPILFVRDEATRFFRLICRIGSFENYSLR